MKKLFQKILEKLVKKAVKKSVEAVEGEDPVVVPEVEPGGGSKKVLWKFIIQTLISILTAILTALGATSCMGAH